MTHNDEFDQILDDALAEYREAEPLAGLEARVLQRLRLQTERRRKPVWRWSAIAAAAAALVIVAWIGLGNHARQELVPLSVAQKQAPAASAGLGTIGTLAVNQPSAKRLVRSQTLHSIHGSTGEKLAAMRQPPAREQFPLPAPLQPEERMLLALATIHPEVLRDKAGDDTAVVIAPINIKPLVDETGSNQGEN